MPGISQRAFAKRKGTTHSKVAKAIANGRITANPDGTLDWSTQSKAWEKNRDPAGQNEAPEGTSLLQARTANVGFAARMRKLQFEKASGKLIDKDAVANEIASFSRYVRNGILTIPDRVSAVVAAEIAEYLKKHSGRIDQETIEKIVAKAFHRESKSVLEDLARGGPNVG